MWRGKKWCGVLGGHALYWQGFEDRGNRAAVLRTAEAVGVLHVHEVNAEQTHKGRARGELATLRTYTLGKGHTNGRISI